MFDCSAVLIEYQLWVEVPWSFCLASHVTVLNVAVEAIGPNEIAFHYV